MYIWSFVVLWHPVSVEWRHYQLPIFVCQVSSSAAMIKTFSYSGWRQYILQIIFMALDGFRGLPDINLSRCMNPLVNFKFIFRKTKRKQKNTIVGVRLFFFYIDVVVKKAVCCISLLSPVLVSLTQKQPHRFTVMSSEFQKALWTLEPPARVKLTPNRTIIPSPSPQKRTLKRFCF